MLLGIGVRYFGTGTPLYIGDILCRGTQNYSYIYVGANLISVILSLPSKHGHNSDTTQKYDHLVNCPHDYHVTCIQWNFS